MTLEGDVVGAASVSTSCSRALASKAKKISEAVAKSIGGIEDLLLARWYLHVGAIGRFDDADSVT
jgi:hypothetical protein